MEWVVAILLTAFLYYMYRLCRWIILLFVKFLRWLWSNTLGQLFLTRESVPIEIVEEVQVSKPKRKKSVKTTSKKATSEVVDVKIVEGEQAQVVLKPCPMLELPKPEPKPEPRKGVERWVENTAPPTPTLTTKDLSNTVQWECSEDGLKYTLYFRPPQGVDGSVYLRIYEAPGYCDGELLPALSLTLDENNFSFSYKERIEMPCAGIVSYPRWEMAQGRGVFVELTPDEIIAEVDCDTKQIAAYLDQEERDKQERIEREQRERIEREKREIAEKIKEKERRKALEREVYNELLANGELSEKGKRPPIPEWMRSEVWTRDGGQCVVCGARENLQFDHIIPFSKGGATSVENLQILCQACNIRKSNHI